MIFNTVIAGQNNGSVNGIKFTYTGLTEARGSNVLALLTSGILTFENDIMLDLFLVGGGGGGGTAYAGDVNPSGGGGGDGYTVTHLAVQLTAGEHSAVIGAGGAAQSNGGTTSLDTYTAAGGKAGASGTSGDSTTVTTRKGGDGGSGGGGGGYGYSDYKAGGAGGTDGGDGSYGAGQQFGGGAIDRRAPGGTGQGTTTRAFGEDDGALFASGGNGGTGNSGVSSTATPAVKLANTGDGGDGGCFQSTSLSGTSTKIGTAGGSGIILLRFPNVTQFSYLAT